MSDGDATQEAFRSGFVALCGRPNVGKSTLVNALVGDELAVATPQPQTTRERMIGVWSGEGFQAVLVDTPGLHRARSALNRFMVAEALRGARDVDLILLLAEAPRFAESEAYADWEPGKGALGALESLESLGRPIVLVLTKCDRLRGQDVLLPVIDTWRGHHDFATVVPVSATTGRGMYALRTEVVARLPPGPNYYPDGELSDRSLRWHAQERIRGELFARLGDELPYSCAVRVDAFEEREDHSRIEATIFVERDSQKGIVVGKGGRTIKAISTGARAKIGALVGTRCDLFLTVSVAPNWTKDVAKLAELGYRGPERS
jgi:GTP-binding protein Era